MRFPRCFFMILLLLLVTFAEGRGHGGHSSSSRGRGGGAVKTAWWVWLIIIMSGAFGVFSTCYICYVLCKKANLASEDQNNGIVHSAPPQEYNLQQMAVQEPIQNNPLPYPPHPHETEAKQQTYGYGDTNNPLPYPQHCPPAYETQGHNNDTPGIPPPAYQSI